VLDLCLKKIFAWQRRAARKLGIDTPMCGAVSFIQRFGSLLNLNCHIHALLPDGVFVAKGDDVEFVPIPPPWPEHVARLVEQIARATDKLIRRRLEPVTPDEPPDVLATEQARSLEGARFPTDFGQTEEPSHRRCAFFYGYSLHAERFINSDDREGLERLCRYGARAPIANSRLSLDDEGNAVVELKRPLRDGRSQLTFTPVELLTKLAILIPPPRKNLTRYYGLFGPAHRHRSAVVPGASTANAQPGAGITSSRIGWAQLLRRVFAIDILRCDQCGGSMNIIAVIPESDISDKILDHLSVDHPGSRTAEPP